MAKLPEHPNAALVRRFFAALGERDAATALSLLADDAVWRFPGTRGQIAGDHVGREGIVRFLHSVMTLTNGTFDLEIHDITASDEHAVVLFTGHGERNGKTLDNPTALVVRISGGKVIEFREFVWDIAHVDDFWS
jgi:uncharacterized protein